MLEQLGLIGTIRDEEESPEEPDTESEQEDEPIVLNRKKKFGSRGAKDFNADFEFGERDALSRDDDWVMADVMKQIKNKRTATTLDQKIEKVRKKRRAEVSPKVPLPVCQPLCCVESVILGEVLGCPS
ncbi:probable ATP-dependent RNA helicase DDX27 [Plectropomus leopardus]|uniref:probable ATP-dependent RNA helicase DDX27 n=1 Tax=Plectropomus leopardus TaxID=160734 RepID=UPI001C4B2C0E|nr:probable ATP-dependent RNA helicase DDX27 [Plectropomus leopardus]